MTRASGSDVLVREVGCSRHDDVRPPECGEASAAFLGFALAVALVVVVVAGVWWRHKMRTVEGPTPGPVRGLQPTHDERPGLVSRARGWRARRRHRASEAEAFRRRLEQEYREGIEARDPETLESTRDWVDTEGTPWRVEVGLATAALGLLALGAVVAVLVAVFLGIEQVVGT